MQQTEKSNKRRRTAVGVTVRRRPTLIRETMVNFIEHVIRGAAKSAKRNSENPFDLLPPNIAQVRKLERSCSTSAGTLLIQNLAAVLAESYLGYGRTNYAIDGRINVERMRRIDHIMNSLESTDAKPNFEKELRYVLDGKNRKTVQVVVRTDFYAVDRSKNHSRIAAECKSPMSNSDQAKAAKEKILKLHAMQKPKVDEAYFVLNYNPYGGETSNFIWSPPKRWFNINNNDSAVLIGREFWDKIGGPGTYDLIIQISDEVRAEYADAINAELTGQNEGINVKNPERLFSDIKRLENHFTSK